ncbi:MAG: anhydro-N-acetylmuramic acid kinase [Pseudomonadota bacterium]
MKINGPVWALGAMSGTSLDGVDAAMICTDGETISEVGEAKFRGYTEAEQSCLRAALGRWPGESGVGEAQEVVETAHAAVLSRFADAELVGFHGQTLAHEPSGRGTHQTGDGALIAELLGKPVIWDFRSNDVKLGGQGAPLAPFYHFACVRFLGETKPVAFLNLGGVGNLTYIDPTKARPEDDGALMAFDTGPANAPINDLMQLRRGVAFDEAGALAAQGDVDEAVVARFLNHSYFHKIPPKSLDRDAFPMLTALVAELADADAAATLTACAAASVAKGLELLPHPPQKIFVTGGGRKNAALMAQLETRAQTQVQNIDATGLDGDMLEAQAFGFLAVRVARGLPTSCPSTTGVAASVGGGRISYPGGLQG